MKTVTFTQEELQALYLALAYSKGKMKAFEQDRVSAADKVAKHLFTQKD